MFFGTVYAMSVGEAPRLPHPGSAFFISALVLLSAALLGWSVARRARRDGDKLQPTA
jgi:DHA1 family tetracycline resistance protein-like MFS transporter